MNTRNTILAAAAVLALVLLALAAFAVFQPDPREACPEGVPMLAGESDC